MKNPNVTFDYGIYIDGVCNQWDEDNLEYGFWTSRNLVREFYSEIGQPYPATLSVYGKVCNAYPISGFGYQHFKDVVPWNIIRGLELQSSTLLAVDGAPLATQGKCLGFLTDWIGVKDKNDNMRPDGSSTELYIYRSNIQDHCELDEYDGLAMQTVASFIQENDLLSRN